MAKDPRESTLVIEQGVTSRMGFRLETPNGVLLDPVTEGYTSAVLQVRDDYASNGGELLLNLTTDNGGIVLGIYTDDDGEQYSGRLYVSYAAANALTPWGEGVYDMLGTHTSGQVDKMAYGLAVLVPVVSEVE